MINFKKSRIHFDKKKALIYNRKMKTIKEIYWIAYLTIPSIDFIEQHNIT